MKKVCLFLLMVFILSACGTRRHAMEFASGETTIPTTAKYYVKAAEDNSGFVFDKEDDVVDIKSVMESALVDKLKAEGMYSSDPNEAFSIKSTVKKYDPGSAFGRWLMPGVGSTVIEVSSDVSGPDGKTIGIIETRNSVDAGGGFTIGAWKYIFEHAATEIVTELKESMGLIAEKK